MPSDPRVKIGTAALVWHHDRLLMQRRAPDATHGGGTWSVPGGWVDWGEDPAEAARRELWEEAGVRGLRPRLIAAVANTYDSLDMHIVCTFFEFGYDLLHLNPENREPNKHDRMEWVHADDLTKMTPHFPPFASLLTQHYGQML